MRLSLSSRVASMGGGGLLGALLVGAILGTSKPANALPAFARQTGLSCEACHFQHFPKLRALGRSFKAHGYSTADQALVTGVGLSLPRNLNATVDFAGTYEDDGATPPARDLPGSLGWDASLLVAGRLGDGIGGLVDLGGAGLNNGKVSFSAPLGGAVVSMTPFMTGEAGPAYGFELLNTGALSLGLPFLNAAGALTGENSNLTVSRPATGISFSGAGDSWFLTYTPFAAGGAGQATGLNWSQYLRAAYTPTLWGWELGLGAGLFAGATQVTNATEAIAVSSLGTQAWFVDGQAQGQLWDRDLGLYALFGVGDLPGPTNLYGGLSDHPSSLAINAEYTLFPPVGVLAGYGHYDRGAGIAAGRYDKIGFGLSGMIQRNILLQPLYEVFYGDARPLDNRLTLTLRSLF